MLVPLAGNMLQTHVDSIPGTVIYITTGAMQNANAAARAAVVLLHFAERNNVKLTDRKSVV